MAKNDRSRESAKKQPEKRDGVTVAFHKLRELIVQGHIAPGSWVVESELAERLELSRTPIRGALQILQLQGFITEQRGERKARLHISPLTKDDANELYQIVGTIESHAGALTASLSEEKRAKICQTLGTLNNRLSAMAKSKQAELRSVFEIDTRFHHEIVIASAGPRLLALHEMMKPQIERYWRLYAHTIVQDLQHSVAEHNEIITAIRAGNIKAVEKALAANWKNGAERLQNLIGLFGERGSW